MIHVIILFPVTMFLKTGHIVGLHYVSQNSLVVDSRPVRCIIPGSAELF